jgi:hypothetical protein
LPWTNALAYLSVVEVAKEKKFYKTGARLTVKTQQLYQKAKKKKKIGILF